MTKKFVLTEAYNEHAAGTAVYSCNGYDYGCSSDDTRYTGIPHVSVTLKETGDYPFFTVPEHLLENAK